MECLLNLSINTDWKPKVQSKHIVFNHLKSHLGGASGFGEKILLHGGQGLREIVNRVYYIKKVLLLKLCILDKMNVFFFKLFLNNLSFLTCGT